MIAPRVEESGGTGIPTADRVPGESFDLMSSTVRSILLLLLVSAIAAFAAYFALLAVLDYATARSDTAASERQSHLAATLVSKMQATVAHDQESSTVWDEAIRSVTAGDTEWIGQNLGEWMYTYFGHDRAYVIRPDGTVVYAFAKDEENAAKAFDQAREIIMPIARKLRKRLIAGDQTGLSDQVLSIGQSDFAVINNHPSIVSIKPIMSDTGSISQRPQDIYFHVAVRYLDGSFLDGMAREYQFDDLNFVRGGTVENGLPAAIMRSDDGIFGYFTWRPFKPGEAVARSVRPVINVVGLVVFLVMSGMGAMILTRNRKLQRSRAALEHLAGRDALTGLLNRARFAGRLAEVIGASAPGQANAVLFLDLDRFKLVNDTLGHAAGDQLLILVANRLRQIFPDGIIGRLGGDEFTAVAAKTSTKAVKETCEAIIEAMRYPFEIDGKPTSIGASVGVAIGTGPDIDPMELTRKADIALYNAKGSGRNRYAIFGQHMDDLVQTRREMEHDLRVAIESRRGLEVHFQPVYAAPDGALSGAEALVRWRHPQRGMIGPDDFIPMAEECGIIAKLGELVLEEACRIAQRWPDLQIAVNASPVELRNSSYALKVTSLLSASRVDPARLEIEITENTILDDAGECVRNIDALRSIGVRFALDDFGTGFSSFARLERLSIDRIKIDKSFLHAAGHEKGNRAVVEAMINLARAKGLKTTAEGVETEDQRRLLKELGCDDLQGYLLSRPLTTDAFEAMLEEEGRKSTVNR